MYKEIDPESVTSQNAHELLIGIDVNEFIEMLDDAAGLMNRQAFCRFLGIRESTLSGWLKDKKLPHYAQMAFGLLVMNGELKRKSANESDCITVKLGDDWGLVRMEKNSSGQRRGRMIASGIESESMARQMLGAVAPPRCFVDFLVGNISMNDHAAYELEAVYEKTFSGSLNKRDSALYEEEGPTISYLTHQFSLCINGTESRLELESFSCVPVATLILIAWKSKSYLSSEKLSFLVDNLISRTMIDVKKGSPDALEMILKNRLLPLQSEQEARLVSELQEYVSFLIDEDRLKDIWDIIKQGISGDAFNKEIDTDMHGVKQEDDRRLNINDPKELNKSLIALPLSQYKVFIDKLLVGVDNIRESRWEEVGGWKNFQPIYNLGVIYLTNEQMGGF